MKKRIGWVPVYLNQGLNSGGKDDVWFGAIGETKKECFYKTIYARDDGFKFKILPVYIDVPRKK